MAYPVLEESVARELFKKYVSHDLSPEDISTFERYKDGPALEIESARDLANILWEIAQDLRPGAKFEKLARPVTHERLNLSPKVAGDIGFWRWLTFASDGNLAELVDWRYGKADEPGSANEIYFGFGQIKKSMYGYLWLCADAAYDSTLEDKYELVRRGEDVDLWQSHIIRIDFGSVPQLARAFVRFLFPSESEQRLSREEYRKLAPELSRRNASIAYELMSEDECMSFIEEVWKERDIWEI